MTDRRCPRCGATLPRHYSPCPPTKRAWTVRLRGNRGAWTIARRCAHYLVAVAYARVSREPAAVFSPGGIRVAWEAT